VEGNLRLDEDMLALNDALEKLASADERLAQVVEMRYFAGLSELEIAELLQRSERSIRRDWQKARMFLLSVMQDS
jgi:RNA polymerase sigma factor (sigma-70 family)